MDQGEIHSIVRNLAMNKPIRTVFPTPQKMIELIDNCNSILEKEPNLLELNGKWVIVGDLHGNFEDLLRIFDAYKYPPETNYLFLGDYVDRGLQSLEVITMLFAIKILFPTKVYLLHGNHEGQYLTSLFNFKNDCEANGYATVYPSFIYCFRNLSLAATINGQFFCVHGCISPELNSLSQIKDLPKPVEDENGQLAENLLWSDPGPEDLTEYKLNDRGAGWYCPSSKIIEFLHNNKMSLLIRSHEYKMNGYMFNYGENGGCLTIFSTSNYCNIDNKGAIAVIQSDNKLTLYVYPPLTSETRRQRRQTLPEWAIDDPKPTTSDLENPVIPPVTKSISDC